MIKRALPQGSLYRVMGARKESAVMAAESAESDLPVDVSMNMPCSLASKTRYVHCRAYQQTKDRLGPRPNFPSY